MTTKKQNIDLSLAMRGIFSLVVVIWHYCGYQKIPNGILYVPGTYAVWGFFSISGYMIYLSIQSKFHLSNWIESFWTNRILRIYPIYILFSFIGFLFLYFDQNINNNYSYTNIISDLFFLKENHTYPLNGVFWTIGIEMQFYIIAPLIFIIAKKFNDYGRILFAITLIFLSNIYLDYTALKTSSHDFRTLAGNLCFFFVGMFMGILRDKFKNHIFSKKNLGIIVIFFMFYFSFNIISMSYSYNSYIFGFFYFFSTPGIIFAQTGFLAMLVIHICLERVKYSSIMLNFLYLLGNSAYAMYACHPFLIKLVGLDNINIFNFSLYLSFTILISIMIYHYFEKPILKYKFK